MEFTNRMRQGLKQIEMLPADQKIKMMNAFISSQVKLLATTDTIIEKLISDECVVTIANQSKVQNHIGTVHAAAMALIAETATGMVLSMNMPDDKIQVAKSMNVKFIKIAKGNLKATATLNEEQMNFARTTEKGDLTIPVKVLDEDGNEPIIAEITWAWFPSEKKKQKDPKSFLQSELGEALKKLNEDSKPIFGDFTPQQMIEHLVWVIKASYAMEFDKSKTSKPDQIQAKKFILEGNNAYPRGIKNPFFKEGVPPLLFETLAQAKEELLKEVNNFYNFFEKPENRDKLFFHTSFGGINFSEIEKGHAIHLMHHLQQFELA